MLFIEVIKESKLKANVMNFIIGIILYFYYDLKIFLVNIIIKLFFKYLINVKFC